MNGKISRRDFLRRIGFCSAGIASFGAPALKVVAHASLATEEGRALIDSFVRPAQEVILASESRVEQRSVPDG